MRQAVFRPDITEREDAGSTLMLGRMGFLGFQPFEPPKNVLTEALKSHTS